MRILPNLYLSQKHHFLKIKLVLKIIVGFKFAKLFEFSSEAEHLLLARLVNISFCYYLLQNVKNEINDHPYIRDK